MTNIPKHRKHTVSRRSMLAGGAATVAALSAMPSGAFAFPGGLGGGLSTSPLRKLPAETTLAKYLCESVHDKIAERLDDIISDPSIDGERTALALMEARCPGCGDRVHPKTSTISAVIPQWRSPVSNPIQGVNA